MDKHQKLLNLLSEESHEVSGASSTLGIQASKALRFGMDEVQVGQDLTNGQRILKAYYKVLYEFTDVVAVMELVFGDNPAVAISSEVLRYKVEEKKLRIAEWDAYAESLNVGEPKQ